MTTQTPARPATAEQLASAVYDALTVEAQDYDETPDGVHYITINGWSLRVFDDTDETTPFGISWWIDSPEERGSVSDGWELLPADQVAAQAAILAAQIEKQAQA